MSVWTDPNKLNPTAVYRVVDYADPLGDASGVDVHVLGRGVGGEVRLCGYSVRFSVFAMAYVLHFFLNSCKD